MPLSEWALRAKDKRASTPALQHRHFAFIAQCIAQVPNKVARLGICDIFSYRLCDTSCAFDSERFRTACDCNVEEYDLSELDAVIAHTTFWLDHLKNERVRRLNETLDALEQECSQ